uniref:Uncharacterized protein n=1 Tax=Setaria digitata TaxID=48799 RepID=A0A915Q759_9BILA
MIDNNNNDDDDNDNGDGDDGDSCIRRRQETGKDSTGHPNRPASQLDDRTDKQMDIEWTETRGLTENYRCDRKDNDDDILASNDDNTYDEFLIQLP